MSTFTEALTANAKKAAEKILMVGTHDGAFHADELLALSIIQEDLPEGWKISVTRTRDKELLDACDLVIDVRGGKFDHHGPDNRRMPNGIPHCAASLILEACEEDPAVRNILLDQMVYAVAAQDNGFELPQGICPSKLSFITSMNPTWLEEQEIREKAQKEGKEFKSEDLFNFVFNRAFGIVDVIYKRARAQAKAVIEARTVCDCSQRIPLTQGGYVLDLPFFVPWLNWAYGNPECKAAMYPDKDGIVVRVASKTPGKFVQRANWPIEWGGKEGAELEQTSTIKDAVFCHRGLFLAKFKHREAALEALPWLKVED